MKYLLLLVCITALLGGCASTDLTQKTLTHSPDFAPVYPLASDANRIPTGGIYGNRQSDAWLAGGAISKSATSSRCCSMNPPKRHAPPTPT